MVIDQRNAGSAVTTDSAYPVDRFQAFEDTDGTYSAQRDTTVPAGFVNSLKWTTTTADTSLSAGQYCGIYHGIEGFNVADLGFGTANASPITLSFWVRSSLTGTFGGSFRNSANNRSYPFTYTISSANTFEYKTVTVAGDTSGTWLTDNGAGLKVFFALGVGSSFSGTAGAWAGTNYLSATSAVSVIGTLNATWYITGVQLEKGSTATSFDYRPYGTELQLCQRYFQIFGVQNGAYDAQSTGSAYSSTIAFVPYALKTTMRTAPSFTLSGSTSNFRYAGSSTEVTPSALAIDQSGSNTLSVKVTTTGLTGMQAVRLYNIDTTGGFQFSAEL
jgi:hypothetical protein